MKLKFHSTENSIYVSYYSRALFDFFSKIGVSPGKKINVDVPEMIEKGSRDIKIAFIRGLAAADFSVCVKNRSNGIYPTIRFVSVSKFLCADVCNILKDFQIAYTSCMQEYVNK